MGFEPTQASAIGALTPKGPEPDPFDLARAPPHQKEGGVTFYKLDEGYEPSSSLMRSRKTS